MRGLFAPQDLVEHCLQMQHQHRVMVQALEFRLEGYGFKPLPEGHELEVEEPPGIFGELSSFLAQIASGAFGLVHSCMLG